MNTILEDEGYVIDLAINGKEAIALSESNFHNVALLDIRLPDIDGVELLTRMKTYVPRVRKIMVTGFPSVENAIDAVNRKADAYIVKPVNVQTLLDTIKTQLELQEMEMKFNELKVVQFIETKAKNMFNKTTL